MPAMKNKPVPVDEPHRMHCMEVWGSNQAVNNGVIMAGLDAWVYAQPWHGDAVGGDLHYVSSCATGRITRLLLADVSGHGETVAETTNMLRQLMRRYVNHVEQRLFVRAMNREFAKISNHRFATTVAASFFAPRKQLIISNAGHPPPLLYNQRAKQWTYIQNTDSNTSIESELPNENAHITNVPLGILDQSDYDEMRLTLAVGDLVLLYSDALIESLDTTGEQLGLDGLLRVVQKLNITDPGEIIQQLRDRLIQLHDDNLEGDDVTIMLFRPNGIGAKANFFYRAWAGVRIIGTIVSRLFGGPKPIPWPEMTLENMLGTPTANFLHKIFGKKQKKTA